MLGVSFVLAVGWGASIALTPLFLDHLGFDSAAIGSMGGWFGAGLLASAPVAGICVRRLGLRRTLSLGMLLYAAVTFALPHLRAPFAIAVARFLDGFATLPCTLAAETALLARPIGRRAFWVSLHGVAVAFGLMLGPLLLRLFSERSFLERYAGASALAVFAAILTCTLLRSLDALVPEDRLGQLTVARITALASQIRTPMIAGFVYGVFLGALLLFGPLLVLHDRALSASTAALLPAFYVLGVCLGSPLASRAADAFGAFRVLFMLAGLGAVAVLMMLLREPPWLVLVAVVIAGALLAPVYPISAALQADLAAPSEVGLSNALHAGAYAAGRFIGPPVLGLLLHLYGENLLLVSLASLWSVFGAAAFWRVLGDRRRRGWTRFTA